MTNKQILEYKFCLDGKEHIMIDDIHTGEVLCEKCGVVFEERTIATEQFFKEIGKSNMSTNLGHNTVIPHDGKLKYSEKKTFNNLRKWDRRIQVNSNHHDKARGELVAKYCEKLELGVTVKTDVHKYMMKLAKDKLVQGRHTVEMLASTIHYVCKKHEIPKSMAEISRHTNVPTKKIYKNYSIICQEYGTVQKVQDIDTYVTQYMTKAKMPIKYEPELRRLLALLKKEKFQEGKSPNVIIASLIRFISINVNDYPITQEKIAEACDVSDVAIRGVLKMLPPSIVLMY